MDEWDFIDDRELQNWKGGVVWMSCQHFTFGVDQHCPTMVGSTSDRSNCSRGSTCSSGERCGHRPGDAGGLGTRSGLKVHLQQRFEPLRVIGSQCNQQLDEQRDGRQRFQRHRLDVTAVSFPCSPDSAACPARTAHSLIAIRRNPAEKAGW